MLIYKWVGRSARNVFPFFQILHGFKIMKPINDQSVRVRKIYNHHYAEIIIPSL